jgi:DNA (cytosine-5)-methyltransferase 1
MATNRSSSPGEALPPIPQPTHSAHPHKTGLKSWTTITSVIAAIPENWPNHNPSLTVPRDASPQDGNKTATCITTSGGIGNIHPSGKRDYTHREFACLQSLPLGHKFAGKGVKRQIGNMVPPVVGTVLLEDVKRSLLKADGLLDS